MNATRNRQPFRHPGSCLGGGSSQLGLVIATHCRSWSDRRSDQDRQCVAMTSPSWLEPPPRHEPGCLKGCLFLVAFVVIGFVVLLGSVYYWGTRSHSAVARGIFWLTKIHAIAEKPATIPSLNVSASAREEA